MPYRDIPCTTLWHEVFPKNLIFDPLKSSTDPFWKMGGYPDLQVLRISKSWPGLFPLVIGIYIYFLLVVSCPIGGCDNDYHLGFYHLVFHCFLSAVTIGFTVLLDFQRCSKVYILRGLVRANMLGISCMVATTTSIYKVVCFDVSTCLLSLNIDVGEVV